MYQGLLTLKFAYKYQAQTTVLYECTFAVQSARHGFSSALHAM